VEDLTRRQFVKIIGLSHTVLLCETKQRGLVLRSEALLRRVAQAAALPKAVSTQASPGKPNIVIMFLDNIGYGDLTCYGNQAMKTPRIDRLAARPELAEHLKAEYERWEKEATSRC